MCACCAGRNRRQRGRMTVSARGLPLSTLVGHSPEASAGRSCTPCASSRQAGAGPRLPPTHVRCLSRMRIPRGWSNLSALAVALGDAAAAVRHAQQGPAAVAVAGGCLDQPRRRELAGRPAPRRRDGHHRALQLAPRAGGRRAQLRADAAGGGSRGAGARGAAMPLRRRTPARGACSGRAAIHASRAMPPGADLPAGRIGGPGAGTRSWIARSRWPASASGRGRTALFVAADLLQAHGIAYHLTSGTLLALVRMARCSRTTRTST